MSVEPGGQLELSTPPCADVTRAVATLRRDRAALQPGLDAAGLGLAGVGADPARPPARISPTPRYVSMEAHFDATGCGPAGRSMMAATAALQVNVEAGPAAGWAARLRLAQRLGPVLVALSACSPMIARRSSGWRSMRQQVWGLLDATRCGPLPDGGEPALEWARYALAAPVMLVRESATGAAEPVGSRVPFAAWAGGEVPLGGRRPTTEDLGYHLTTLWPPVRPRGHLEIRYLDAVPERCWPALAAITVTLLDDAWAADLAAAACEPVGDAWAPAAREGLRDPAIARAVRACAAVAVARVPAGLRAEVEAYAELVSAGRTPGDDLRDRLRRMPAHEALVEASRA
jgi:ergothioneine biosynthesis glutamate--cysteine ligase EgtA